jgi:hypothetical protein
VARKPKSESDVLKNEVQAVQQKLADDAAQVQQQVNDMDLEFNGTQPDLDGVSVQVLKVGADGRLTDVTDKVNPRDIRPEQITEIRGDAMNRIPTRPDGTIDKEAAMNLLSLLVGGTSSTRLRRNASDTSAESIRRMEKTLAESDKILEHWKK